MCACRHGSVHTAYPNAVTARSSLLRRAVELSILSILLSGLGGAIAVAVGLSTGSLSLLGFGFDAAIDAAASIALVWRFVTESREPHRADRVERIAEFVIGCVLLFLAAYLTVGALRSLAGGLHPEVSVVAIGLLVASLAVLPPMALAKHRVAAALGSRALRGDSILTAIAAVLAAVSLGSLLADQWLGIAWADAAGAVVVAAIVTREGFASVRSAQSPATG